MGLGDGARAGNGAARTMELRVEGRVVRVPAVCLPLLSSHSFPFHSAPGSRKASLSVSISSGVHSIFVKQFIPSCPLLSEHSDNS